MTEKRNPDDLMWEQEFNRDFPGLVEKLRTCAEGHKNGVHDNAWGSPFRWSIAICIGYQCFEVPHYRANHGITEPYERIKQWCIDQNIFMDYKGDVDFLALLAGRYNEWIVQKEEEK